MGRNFQRDVDVLSENCLLALKLKAGIGGSTRKESYYNKYTRMKQDFI